ncbi:uncharacterized protein LOC111400721 [Olea europaea var. sylvestris]|uniref:uncharacterized protein LOC111400721 n=1 Tax=Olea europaea var. sylvestris TaxID=158386 RepID=UPI000C1D3330|nr:uncharacterized protein LOC111400721 [Olea europaea var. sylvestris]
MSHWEAVIGPHRQSSVIPELTPSMEEDARGLVRDLGVLHTPDEEMSDPSLDRDWESSPADRQSPPPRASPPPLASSPSRVSSPPLALPPLVASPPSGPSPPPLALPPSRHLPRVSPGHSDDLYARLTGFIAEEIGALRRDLTERDTIAVLRGDLAGRRWWDRGNGGDHDREDDRDGDGEGGGSLNGDGRGDYKGDGPDERGGGGGDGGGGPDGRGEGGGNGGEGSDGGTEEVAPEVERTLDVIEGKRSAVDEMEQVVGKRLRVPSYLFCKSWYISKYDVLSVMEIAIKPPNCNKLLLTDPSSRGVFFCTQNTFSFPQALAILTLLSLFSLIFVRSSVHCRVNYLITPIITRRRNIFVFSIKGGGNVRVKSRFVIQVGDTNQTTPYNLLHRLMKMTEKPKVVDSGSDSLSSNCEFEGKGNQNVLLCDRVNGLQQQGIESDSFVVDMDRFEEEIYKKSRIKLQRNLSRKGSLSRGSEKKINQSTSNNIRDTSLVANSPRGYPFHRSSMLEIPVLETLGAVDRAINFPVHNQLTVVNGTVDNMAVESKYFGKRFSFRQSSSFSWIIDPRRILIFFATLSSLGTILLIYLTLSMSKLNAE